MLDEVARDLVESAMLPSGLPGEEARNLISRAFLRWLASRVFESQLEDSLGDTPDDLMRLSLAASLLQDGAEPDPATAFLVAESADVAGNFYSLSTVGETPLATFRRAVNYLDLAAFFHLSDYDANANVLARQASDLLAPVDFAQQEIASDAQVEYYRAVGDFLTGRFRSCLDRSAADVQTNSAEERAFSFLRSYLGHIVLGYLGKAIEASDEYEKLLELSEVLQTEGQPFSILRSEVDKLMQISAQIGRKSMYRLLASSFDNHKDHFQARLEGNTEGSYVFAWPPTQEFCSDYVDGDNRHAVITTPTGTGKSFLAELAIAEALKDGWVLYVAPTNALCAQITNDLRDNLNSLSDVEVKGFPGELDYSPELPTFQVSRNILVITPEKALLLLKREPDVFREFSLLVLDEFHIFLDRNRGNIAETVLSFALAINPELRVILMSALVENSTDLAHWIEGRIGGGVAVIPSQADAWRPTRIARLTVFPDQRTLTSDEDGTKEIVKVRAFADTVTPWEEDTPLHTWLTPIQIERQTGDQFPWRNEVSRKLSETFVEKGIKTLIFVLKNRHEAFSIASKFEPPSYGPRDVTNREEDLYTLSEYELGAPSLLESLVKEQGAAVHTSAMLDCEREAAQMAFGEEGVDLLVATGTLSQGLNLMARAVIVCGTQLSEHADYDMTPDEFRQQSLNQVLNALGRAARANITCRGVSVIVPDHFEWHFDETSPKHRFFQYIEALRLKDAALTVDSPVGDLLSEVETESLDRAPNRAERLLLARLPSDPGFLRLTLENSLGAAEIESEE